jgi:HEAT repeat protein
VSPLELLSLPESNRLEVAKTQAKELYPKLIEMAFNEERSVPTRWKALILAAQIDQVGSRADLDRALKDKQWFMRNAALVALQAAHSDQTQKVAVQLLGDKALVVRSAAVAAIDEHADNNVRESLWAELRADYNFRQGQSLWVRREIVEKLSARPQRVEYTSFASALRDRDHALHPSAIAALEKITKLHLGAKKSTSAEREKLWVDYVSAHPMLR